MSKRYRLLIPIGKNQSGLTDVYNKQSAGGLSGGWGVDDGEQGRIVNVLGQNSTLRLMGV